MESGLHPIDAYPYLFDDHRLVANAGASRQHHYRAYEQPTQECEYQAAEAQQGSEDEEGHSEGRDVQSAGVAKEGARHHGYTGEPWTMEMAPAIPPPLPRKAAETGTMHAEHRFITGPTARPLMVRLNRLPDW